MAQNANAALVTLVQKTTIPDPTTPTRVQITTAPSIPRSPAPAAGEELHHFLIDLVKFKRIDIVEKERVLTSLDLTPDIIPNIPLLRFCELTGLLEGGALKVQKYCKEWFARVEEKRML